MVLTYTDAALRELGAVECEGDFDIGAGEDDFSLLWPRGLPLPPMGSLVYAEGTDVGGVVRSWDTTGEAPRVGGDTWTGLLASRVVGPPAGQAHLRAEGELNSAVASLVALAGLGDVVSVSQANSGVRVSHTFTGSRDSAQQDSGRYMGLWPALWQLCLAHGCKLRARWREGGLDLAGMPAADWSREGELTTSSARCRVRVSQPTNHLVCLGRGELASREVLHLWCDASGAVSRERTQRGLAEVAEVYDYPSSEDLEADGRRRLSELWAKGQSVSVDVPDGLGVPLELGDVVGATDVPTGVTARATVTRRTVAVPSGSATYETTIRQGAR